MKIVTLDSLRYFLQKIDTTYSKFSGNYNDLTNKPNIPSAYTLPKASSSVLGGIKVGSNLSIDLNGILSADAQQQVQSNWSQSNSSAVDYIKNKPNLSVYQTSAQVTDAIESFLVDYATESFVNQAVADKATQSYVNSQISSSVANKATTAYVDSQVENAVADKATVSYVNSKVAAVYKPSGTLAFSALPTPSSSNLGNVYNISNSFITNDKFLEGSGKSYTAGTNVVVVSSGSYYKFDVLAGMIDLSPYAKKTDFTSVTNAEIDSLF